VIIRHTASVWLPRALKNNSISADSRKFWTSKQYNKENNTKHEMRLNTFQACIKEAWQGLNMCAMRSLDMIKLSWPQQQTHSRTVHESKIKPNYPARRRAAAGTIEFRETTR